MVFCELTTPAAGRNTWRPFLAQVSPPRARRFLSWLVPTFDDRELTRLAILDEGSLPNLIE